MKRLRYWIWSLVLILAHELEPGECPSEYPQASQGDKDCGCGYEFCEWPEGHPGKHRNNVGIEWS